MWSSASHVLQEGSGTEGGGISSSGISFSGFFWDLHFFFSRRTVRQAIKMARRAHLAASKHRSKSRKDPKHRKTSLFRKLSSKKATAEMQQLAAAGGAAAISSSQSLQSLRETTPNLMRSLPPNLIGNYTSIPSTCSTLRQLSDNSSCKTSMSGVSSASVNHTQTGPVLHTGSSDSPPSDSCSSRYLFYIVCSR